MSCEAYREKLSDVLLRGETVLTGAVAMHLRTCADCSEFHEVQKRLLGAMDAGLRKMANEEVPVSLLPGVRAQMEESEVAWTWPRWLVPAAGVIALVLLALVPLVRWRLPVSSQQTVNRIAHIVPQKKDPSKASEPVAFSTGALQRQHPVVKTFSEPETIPQGAILSPEQAAVAKFASEHPEEMAEVVRAANSEPMDLNKPIEIAPLKIENIELAPLKVKTENDFSSVDNGSSQFLQKR